MLGEEAGKRLSGVVASLAEDIAARHCGQSLNELRGMEFAKDIETRLGQWESERSDGQAEAARITQAVVRELYAAADMTPPGEDIQDD